MTIRAFIVGLLCVAVLCSATYFNDHVMQQTFLIGNSMPISVYGILVVFLAVVYPVLRRLHRRLAFSRAELAVIMGMTLMSCAVPGSNFMRLFTPCLVAPHRFALTEPGWQQWHVVQRAPQVMLVDVATNRDTVVDGFIKGLRTGSAHIAPATVPWQAWMRPLLFWIPCVLLLWTALICLGVIVHRQWVRHEFLPYPIVAFTASLFPESDKSQSAIFSDKLFWGGFATASLFHLYNYLSTIMPNYTLGILPTGVDLGPLAKLSTPFWHGGGSRWLTNYAGWYFTVIAIAYFLPSDVSLSLGLGPFAWTYINGLLIMYGLVSTSWYGSSYLCVQPANAALTGAYIGMLLFLLYTGRHHFATVFGRACGLRTQDAAEQGEIWSARLFIAAIAAFVGYLWLTIGFDPYMGLLYALLCCAFYLVMGRLIAETGLFFMGFCGGPTCVLLAFFGPRALGPDLLIPAFMLSMVLIYDHRESLLAYTVNSLKLGDDYKVKPARIAMIGMIAIIVGMAVAIPVQLYVQYDYGSPVSLWQVDTSREPFAQTIMLMQRLDAQGVLADAGTHTGLSRFFHAAPHPVALTYFAVSGGLVLLFSFLRTRCAKWPIHPVIFLAMGNYISDCFAQSFLVGWAVKAAVTHYGGASVFQKGKTLMFGLIAGEMIGGLIPMIVSGIYNLATNRTLAPFVIMPQ